ncbi:hypothetical protein NC651_013740 [Populus alba x Populus x berolinensis]|nr:hypothetical protein NC651_013740 [Populus alba x Populus x berolinensis]
MRPQNLRFFTFTIFTVLVLQVDSTQPPFSCDSSNPSTKTFPFCKTTLPISQRATDLVSRLTLEEKISQLVNSAQPIPRLGIPGYQWWSEALHGVSYAGPGIRFTGTIKRATSFPQVILSAASFDANQWYRISQAIGKEARALYNAGQATGMTFWAPNINIFRDPRWGRGQETPGEDPLMTGKYAVSYVRGLQGDSFKGGEINGPLQASACCKHFTAYDLENWNGTSRYVFDAYVTAQDLADTYQPPFKSCVEEGRASGIINFNIRVITILYIASDCDAVSIIHDAQGYAKTPEDAVQHTRAAVDQNKLSISEIDRALHNLFSVRMRLGLFNGNPTGQQFGNIGPDQVCSQENQMLALDAARNGIVLLKNSAGLLPLPKSKTMSLAVIGPNANSVQTLLGNYAGPPCKLVTPLQALQSYIKHTIPYPGCDSVECSSASIDGAVNIAKGADHVVLIMGLDDTQEKEGLDRRDLVLPGKQQELIISVAKAAKNPVVLVLLSGGPIDVSFAKNDENIGSILWAGYPGEAGAIALAEIIFGDHNPGGKLPMTWYPQEFVKVPMTDMRMRPEASSGYPGRTYRFYKGPTVFEFGYGLSYSKYTYELSANNRKIGSILWAGYPGQAGATALAQIIFGEHNPGGRLPLTWYPQEFTKVPMTDMRMRPQPSIGNPGRTYRFYEGEKVFEFGYGLSYSDYSYAFASVAQNQLNMKDSSNQQSENSKTPGCKLVSDIGEEQCEHIKFKVTVSVKNEGQMAGGGEKTEIEYELSPCEHLSSANEDGVMVMEEGSQILLVGDKEHPVTIIV